MHYKKTSKKPFLFKIHYHLPFASFEGHPPVAPRHYFDRRQWNIDAFIVL
jgi:hypothetical protein